MHHASQQESLPNEPQIPQATPLITAVNVLRRFGNLSTLAVHSDTPRAFAHGPFLSGYSKFKKSTGPSQKPIYHNSRKAAILSAQESWSATTKLQKIKLPKENPDEKAFMLGGIGALRLRTSSPSPGANGGPEFDRPGNTNRN